LDGRIFKPVEINVRRGKIEEMDQFGLSYIYTWKCHKETPCIAILNKQKYLFFFFFKNGEQEGQTGPSGDQWEEGGDKERV
jgi:hypothetical protein